MAKRSTFFRANMSFCKSVRGGEYEVKTKEAIQDKKQTKNTKWLYFSAFMRCVCACMTFIGQRSARVL